MEKKSEIKEEIPARVEEQPKVVKLIQKPKFMYCMLFGIVVVGSVTKMIIDSRRISKLETENKVLREELKKLSNEVFKAWFYLGKEKVTKK